MSVKIVTDSTSDLPKEVAAELGITVVPLNVHFGLDTFKDGVDMRADQFYQRLLTSTSLPKTSAPSPGLFRDCYNRLARESQEIVSIHISSRLSGTYEAAVTGKRDNNNCHVEVIDSMSASMGLGLTTVAAAKAAREGATMDEVIKLTRSSIRNIYLAAALDTLEFLQKGGRIGKAQAWFGSLMSIKPIISLAEGEVIPLERVRTYPKVIARINQLLEEHLPARELAVIYSTDSEEAKRMVAFVKQAYPRQPVYLAQFGPVLGTYMGPNSLAIVTLN